MYGDEQVHLNHLIESLWSDTLVIALRGGYFACEPSWELAPRVRPNYQLWLCTRGTAWLDVSSQMLDLTSGTAIGIPPDVLHCGGHDPKNPLHCYVLHFNLRLTSSAAPLLMDLVPRVLLPSSSAQALLLRDAAEVCTELADSSAGHSLLANSAMAHLLGVLWREASEQNIIMGSGGDSRRATGPVGEVLIHVAAHYAEPLTHSDLANVAGFSPPHLNSLFRKVTGLSPIRYLQRYRLQRAKDLLISSDMSVAQIAHSVGFMDPLYFSRAFKQSEGVAPTQYRLSGRTQFLP